MEKNIPILMGLLGVWNMSFLNYKCRTIIPYAEALMKFPAHIQQVRLLPSPRSRGQGLLCWSLVRSMPSRAPP